MMKMQTSLFKQITPAEQSLLNIANSHTSVAYRAQALLYAARGTEFDVLLPELPNAAGSGGHTVFKTNMETSKNLLVNIYPNPANDIVLINTHLQNNEKASISICDINGHILTKLPIEGTAKYQINTATYTSGIYYCVVTKGDNTVQRIKLAIIK